MTPLPRLPDGACRRLLSNGRAWNITLRTAHIAAAGILLGGHAFDVPAPRLLLSLWCCIGTGVVLGALEAGPRLVWFHQGRGLLTLAKLGLLCAVPFLWDHWHLRLTVMLVVVAIASVGSHMPARFRYYSVIYREVIPCGSGPGIGRLDDELDQDPAAENSTLGDAPE